MLDTAENEVSQWSRVKRGMKACEWVSAGVGEPCIPLAANLPASPLSPPTSQPLLKKAAASATECLLQHSCRQSGCETFQMKVHSAQTHSKHSLPLLLTHCPLYEPCWIKNGGEQNRK